MKNKVFIVFSILLPCFIYAQHTEAYYIEKARYAFNEEKNDSAYYYADRVLTINAKNKDASYIKLMIEQSKGDCASMEKTLNGLAQTPEAESGQFAYFLMEKLYCEGKKDLARAVLEEYSAKHPENYSMMLELGDRYIVDGSIDTGIATLHKVISLQPGNPEGYRHLSRIFVLTERKDDAIKLLKDGLEDNPGNSKEFYYLLSCTYKEIGYYERALFFITKAIEITPDERFTVLRDEIIKTQQIALAEYSKNRQLITKNACDTNTLISITNYQIFNALYNEGIKSSEKALKCKFDPDSDYEIFFYRNIITSYFYLDKYKEAEALLDLVIKKGIAKPNDYLFKSILLARNRKYQEALNCISKSPGQYNSDSHGYLKLFLYSKLNMQKELEEELRKTNINNLQYYFDNDSFDKKTNSDIALTYDKEFRYFDIYFRFNRANLERAMKASQEAVKLQN